MTGLRTPPLEELLALAGKATTLRDALRFADRSDPDTAVADSLEHTTAAENLTADLRTWAGTIAGITHRCPAADPAHVELSRAAGFARLAGDHLLQTTETHRRQTGEEGAAGGPEGDDRLRRTAGTHVRAAMARLAPLPLACTDAAAVLAPTRSATLSRQAHLGWVTPSASLSPLQRAALRAISDGSVTLSSQPGQSTVHSAEPLSLTRRTLDPLERQGLVRSERRSSRLFTWRLHLTPAGQSTLLDDFARAPTPTPAPAPAPRTPPQHRHHR